MGQYDILEAGEDLLTPIKRTSQIPTNLEEVDKYSVRAKLTSDDISKLWSTEDLFGRNKKELLVWHHWMNYCSFKFLIRLSNRVIIPRKLNKIRIIPPCVAFLFVKSHKTPWSTKGKLSGGSIRKALETRPRAMDVSNPRNILGNHHIFGSLLQILLRSPHEGNLSWLKPSGQGSLWLLGIHPQCQGLRLQSAQWKVHRAPVQGSSPNLRTKYKLLWGGLSPPKRNCWAQDQGIDPRKLDPPTPRPNTFSRSC